MPPCVRRQLIIIIWLEMRWKSIYLKNVRNSNEEDNEADDGNEDLVATEVLVKNSTVFDWCDDNLHGSELLNPMSPALDSFADLDWYSTR